MLKCNFAKDRPVSYHYSGKFRAPTSEWVHLTRQLFDYELFFVLEGTLHIADSENKYTVTKDNYLLMPPTKKQYGYAPSNCSFFWLHFEPSIIDSIDGSLSFSIKNSIPNMERIIILFNQLQDSDRRYHDGYTNDLLATGILLELYHQLQTQQNRNHLTSKDQLYQAILDYISWNKFNRISVVELSEYFGYNKKYLSSTFKSMSRISLKQYILQEMMELAKAELMDTNKTISQIGYTIGYTDNHNFSHAFKNVVGVTPTDYRISCSKIPKTP